MKAVVFDPTSGASGDMIIGSLVDLGARKDIVENAMTCIADFGEVEVDITKTNRLGIGGTRVNVTSDDSGDRRYTDIVKAVESCGLDDAIIRDAIAIYERIADAESRIHGMPKNRLHFHEVGTADAIADVMGACAAFHDLGFRECTIQSTPVYVGSGFVDTKHGRLSVPAPATLEILCDSSLILRGGPVEEELLTPTGAAILAHFVQKCDIFFPEIAIKKIGYGAGSKELDMPNVLRIVIGEMDTLIHDSIVVLETNVDDVTGEILGNLLEELMKLGAKDVAIIPATMKKGRSGHIIQIIAKPADVGVLARKVIEETGSLGVRVMPTRHRLIAKRKMASVAIEVAGRKHKADVKIATDNNGKLVNISAEFDDCKRIANENGIPVKEVIRRVEEVAWSRFK